MRVLRSVRLEGFWRSEQLPSALEWRNLVRRNIRRREEQLWLSQVRFQSKLRTYILVKQSLVPEKYLFSLRAEETRMLTTFRSGSSKLRVETGRWKGEKREQRVCQMCALDVEDERHMLLHCPAYQSERRLLAEGVARISYGRLRLSCMPEDVQLRILMGCGSMDSLYVPIFRIVARYLIACFAYRARFLLLSV